LSYVESHGSQRSGFSQRTVKAPSLTATATSTTSYASIDPGLPIFASAPNILQSSSKNVSRDPFERTPAFLQSTPSGPEPSRASKGKEPERIQVAGRSSPAFAVPPPLPPLAGPRASPKSILHHLSPKNRKMPL